MANRKRALLISCAIILLCLAIIAGMTYSLFTESFTVQNHLQAGDLDIQLTRTNLKYGILNADGYIEDFENKQSLELTNTNTADLNVFGIDSKDIRIAPECYFEAAFEIDNIGEVAFNYSVDLVLSGEATDLAKQLQVTITESDGDVVVKWLSDLTAADGYYIAHVHEMSVNDPAETFTVRIDFVDDVVYNPTVDLNAGETFMDNDLAQTKTAKFDLIVSATQQSKPGSTATNP
ncbi:MAG: hypothetical protein IKC26_00890 [Clostridia bacterium]|nr:hypothetical protein [Clostridia bacterium]